MSTTSILIDLFKNGLRMGPLVNARMTAASTLALPHGIAFAGAQGAIQAVQSDSAEGAATLTADLVDLGFTKTIVAVTLNLIDREKSDIVVAISIAMMAKGYVTQMTYITQEVLAQGRFDAGAKISGQMMQEGNMDFVKVWNEARKAQGGEEATDEDPKSVKDQLKEAVGSVSSNAKNSDAEAEKATEEGEKSLQQKAKEGAGRMTNSIQEAYENVKDKANS
ncbi:hypothetical protein WJX82_007179 [Trebouxia sp. C0006]